MIHKNEKTAEQAFDEGYALGMRHRDRHARPHDLVDNIAMWVDGEHQPYRDHPLRTDHVRGYTAGYLGRPALFKPATT